MRLIFLSLVLMTSCIAAVSSQTLQANVRVELSGGEVLLSTASDGSHVAYTLKSDGSTSQSGYYVVADESRLGPYDDVRDILYVSAGDRLLYAAKTEDSWYVHHGLNTYGPYTDVRKLRSGTAQFECLYFGDNEYVTSTLFANGRPYCGSMVTECLDYEVSADGTSVISVEESLLTRGYDVEWNVDNWRNIGPEPFAEVKSLRISQSGDAIAFIGKREVPDTDEFEYYIYVYREIFGQIIEKHFGPFLAAGDLRFVWDNFADCMYSAMGMDGTWRLYTNDQATDVSETDITVISRIAGSSDLIYAGMPGMNTKESSPDRSSYYLYQNGTAIAGPYLEIGEVRADIPIFTVTARIADGWYFIVQGGGVGPFGAIEIVGSWDDRTVAIIADFRGEHMSYILSTTGLKPGSLIRKNGDTNGLVFYDAGYLHIVGN